MLLDTLRGQWLIYEIRTNNAGPREGQVCQTSADIADSAPTGVSAGDEQGWGRDSPRAEPLIPPAGKSPPYYNTPMKKLTTYTAAFSEVSPCQAPEALL